MRPIKLILLDVDDVLLVRTNRKADYPCFKQGKQFCYVRPGAKEFIEACSAQYDVGIYTSMISSNVKSVLNQAFGENFIQCHIDFICSREYTRLDPDYRHDPKIKSYDTVKLIDNILGSPILNEKRKYNVENTILIDNSYRKVRFNDISSVIVFKASDKFSFEKEDDESVLEYPTCQSFNEILDMITSM